MDTKHVSVMLDEVIHYLIGESPETGGNRVILDCTLGGGGHSLALLSADPHLVVVGVDKDKNVLARLKEAIETHKDRLILARGDFRNLKSTLSTVIAQLSAHFQEGRVIFDGILADLGMSSDQLNDSSRGFAFSAEGPLDMRMDPDSALTAEEVVTKSSFAFLKKVFMRGGVGRASAELAKQIVARRPLKTTTDLKHICELVMPRFDKKRNQPGSRSHSATVPFQAVRMEVNGEVKAIEGLLDQVPELLSPRGRFAVISFHSLEDKLIARKMRQWSIPGTVPRGLIAEAKKPFGRLLTKHAVIPTEQERADNPRARSARLRVFERGED